MLTRCSGVTLSEQIDPLQDARVERLKAVGLISESIHASEIITEGDADLVFIAREMLREPYWAVKAERELGQAPILPVQYERARQ